MDLELPPLDRPLQVGFQRQALHQGGVHLGAVQLAAAGSGALGRVHGDVGAPQQLVRAAQVRAGDGHADRGPQRHRPA